MLDIYVGCLKCVNRNSASELKVEVEMKVLKLGNDKCRISKTSQIVESPRQQ